MSVYFALVVIAACMFVAHTRESRLLREIGELHMRIYEIERKLK